EIAQLGHDPLLQLASAEVRVGEDELDEAVVPVIFFAASSFGCAVREQHDAIAGRELRRILLLRDVAKQAADRRPAAIETLDVAGRAYENRRIVARIAEAERSRSAIEDAVEKR